MSSSQTFHSPDSAPLGYEAVGHASIALDLDADGVGLVANADGLRSLARLFLEMAERSTTTCHIHLTPGMQLTQSSVGLVVARNEHGQLPDGSRVPRTGGVESNG